MKHQPLNIFTILGTRPEVIKLFPVLEKLRHSARFKSLVVCTSQHREMVNDLLTLFSIKPDHDLSIIRENQSLADISTRALSGLDPLLKRYSPDLVLVQGDTTTAFIGALAASYHKIPVGHLEAGLRSFDRRHPYPEEINRRLISVICNLHFAPTVQNAKNLVNQGVPADRIFLTGNTVIDCLHYVANKNCQTLIRYIPEEISNGSRLIVVTAHRRENWGKPLENLCYALKDVARSFSDVQIIYPVHLNPNVRKTVLPILAKEENIHLLDPLPYGPFIEAMSMSYLIITDSGGIQEEGLSLRKPILVFRKVTERQEGVATGGLKLVGTKRKSVVRETSRLLNDEALCRQMTAEQNPFGDGQAAKRVVQAILHYFHRGARPQDFVPETVSN